MEEIASTVAVPFTLGNLILKESAVTTHMEITGLNLMANTSTVLILINPSSIKGCLSFSVGSEDDTYISPQQHHLSVSLEVKENQVGAELVSEMVLEGDSVGRNDEEFKIAKDFQYASSNNKSSPFREESTISRTNFSEVNTPNVIVVDDNIGDRLSLNEAVKNNASVVMKHESEDESKSDGHNSKPFDAVHEMLEKQICITSCHNNALELSNTPRWGFSSICGRRQEMEDAIVIKPHLFQVPSTMLMDDDHVNENTKTSLAHFFGVYDGHGGSEVCIKILPINYTTILLYR